MRRPRLDDDAEAALPEHARQLVVLGAPDAPSLAEPAAWSSIMAPMAASAPAICETVAMGFPPPLLVRGKFSWRARNAWSAFAAVQSDSDFDREWRSARVRLEYGHRLGGRYKLH